MRRTLSAALLVLAALTLAPLPMAGADEPGPTVVLGPPPFLGPDVMIRAAGAAQYVGAAARGQGRIEQGITQHRRAVSYVRVCRHTSHGQLRVEGTSGGRHFTVSYRVGSRDVTRPVLAGTYRPQLHGHPCSRQIKVVARLKRGATSTGRTLRIRATAPTGAGDSVATRVTVLGPLAVP